MYSSAEIGDPSHFNWVQPLSSIFCVCFWITWTSFPRVSSVILMQMNEIYLLAFYGFMGKELNFSDSFLIVKDWADIKVFWQCF
jgi:hypothetical protein